MTDSRAAVADCTANGTDVAVAVLVADAVAAGKDATAVGTVAVASFAGSTGYRWSVESSAAGLPNVCTDAHGFVHCDRRAVAASVAQSFPLYGAFSAIDSTTDT